MNNIMNATNKPNYIFLRVTAVNGHSFDLQLDVTPLTYEALNPVLDFLVNGNMDPQFDTLEIWEYIQSVMDSTAEALLYSCFDGRKYKHVYAIDLISHVAQAGLCCENCGIEVASRLSRLYMEYMKDSESVVRQIAQNLYAFFKDTTPFVFDVL
jgi:hypothetical protein